MDNTYFAAQDAKETVSTLLMRNGTWMQSIESNGYMDKLRSMWRAYYGCYFTDFSAGHQITFGGEQGELAQFAVNHLRNIASHMITMTTSNRPRLEARAVNTDYKSISQTKLATGILDYYMREKRLEVAIKKAVETAVVLSAGYIKLGWNATAGEIYDYLPDEITGEPDPKRPVYEGDLEFQNLTPFDISFDGTKENSTDNDWYLVRTFKNKYDLAAKYPEYEEKIKGLETKSEMERYRLGFNTLQNSTDDIPVYEFYHKKTDVLPNGRYMLFLQEDIVLQDIGLPYRVIPIFRISAADILGTPYGYTPMFDLLNIQEAVNSLYSTILTNQNATGVQNFWTKPGNQLNVTELVGGLNLIESMDKPEVLQLCQTPAEVFSFLQSLVKDMETISGVNSVARGSPESSLKTGAALALVQSMALQFMSGLQQSYVQLNEDVGSAIIKILQDYAKAPRMIAIVGKTNRTQLKEFVGDDISKISRVKVDVGNPLANTIAGRMQLADQMIQYMGNKLNPSQIVQVLETGDLNCLIGEEGDELDLILRENEEITDGDVPPVMFTDDHKMHIKEHKRVLQDPQLRRDPGLVERTTAHIQMHIDELRTIDPATLGLLEQPSLPPIQPPGGPSPMEVPQQGQTGMKVDPGNEQIQGPGIEGGQNLPNLPKVPAGVLPDPQIQQQAMWNVKQ